MYSTCCATPCKTSPNKTQPVLCSTQQTLRCRHSCNRWAEPEQRFAVSDSSFVEEITVTKTQWPGRPLNESFSDSGWCWLVCLISYYLPSQKLFIASLLMPLSFWWDFQTSGDGAFGVQVFATWSCLAPAAPEHSPGVSGSAPVKAHPHVTCFNTPSLSPPKKGRKKENLTGFHMKS